MSLCPVIFFYRGTRFNKYLILQKLFFRKPLPCRISLHVLFYACNSLYYIILLAHLLGEFLSDCRFSLQFSRSLLSGIGELGRLSWWRLRYSQAVNAFFCSL